MERIGYLLFDSPQLFTGSLAGLLFRRSGADYYYSLVKNQKIEGTAMVAIGTSTLSVAINDELLGSMEAAGLKVMEISWG